MATAIAAQAMLNAQLECGVCHEVFKEPRMLPCGHTFCFQCIQNVVTATSAANTNTHNRPCPLCRVEFSVHNLRDLPRNFTLANLISSLPANSTCALHDDGDKHGPATYVCVQCWDALCTTCARAHTKSKLTKVHSVKLWSDITPDDYTAHKAMQPVYCEIKEHKDEQQKVTGYCDTCKRFVCNTCTGIKCKSHTCLELSDANIRFTTQTKAALTPLLDMKQSLDIKINDTSAAIKQVNERNQTALQEIDNLFSRIELTLNISFEKLLTQLQQCKDTAKLNVTKSNNEHLSQLQASLADTQTTAHNIQQQVHTIEQHLTPTSTVFDKLKVVNTLLPNIKIAKHLTQQTQTSTSTWSSTFDMGKWQSEMKTWCQSITYKLASATTCLPRLTDATLALTRLSAVGPVTSAKHARNSRAIEISGEGYDVEALSVSSDGRLLVGQIGDCQLHVYNIDGSHVTSITLPHGDTVRDAVWTPRGNIVYSTVQYIVAVMTQSGDVIHQTEHSDPWCLSVSTDNVIYLADYETGVYQSTDDGVTWSPVFNVAYGWHCKQAIKVSTDSDTDVFWTLEKAGDDYRVQEYTVDKRRVGSRVTWGDITTLSHVTVDWSNRLACDGHTSIFVVDRDNPCVHVWSVSGQYERQLVSRQQLTNRPVCIAIDTQHSNVMYVGQEDGTVDVFELTYESQ